MMLGLDAPARVWEWLRHDVEDRIVQQVGGPARLKVIVVLACVLGLQAADLSTVGAVAAPLERFLRLSNLDVGLLVTITSAVGVVATLPVGVLVDRLTRTRVLIVSILMWCGAEVAGAVSPSYIWLLLTRLALGAVVATAGPTVASLVGDYFRVSERARIYGFVLTGQLVGAGIGVLVSGDLAAVSWRLSFAWLALPGLALAGVIWRFLPEPARGGQSRLARGAEEIRSADDVAEGTAPAGVVGDQPGVLPGEAQPGGLVEKEVVRQGVQPRPGLVLDRDPSGRDLVWAVRYVLAIPTNRLLILGSALGYFYFQGLNTFAVEFLRGRYGLSQAGASSLAVVILLGAVAGVLLTGRVADHLVSRGGVSGRVWVAGISYLAAAGLLLAGFLSTGLFIGVALFFLGAAGLAGANPPLDAARLDVMHSRLWGRAEAVRTAIRSALEAVAPLLFGTVSGLLAGSPSGLRSPTEHAAKGSGGLDLTFLVMLVALVGAGLAIVAAHRTYPRDVATAMSSERATNSDPVADGQGPA